MCTSAFFVCGERYLLLQFFLYTNTSSGQIFCQKKARWSSFHFTKFFCISENIFTRLTNLHFLARARTHIKHHFFCVRGQRARGSHKHCYHRLIYLYRLIYLSMIEGGRVGALFFIVCFFSWRCTNSSVFFCIYEK